MRATPTRASNPAPVPTNRPGCLAVPYAAAAAGPPGAVHHPYRRMSRLGSSTCVGAGPGPLWGRD